MKSDFLTIPASFNQLGLSAIEKMALALVWGFDKDGNGVFYGSVAYIQEWLGCSKPTAIATLKKLETLGYIKRGTGIFGGEIRRTFTIELGRLKNLTPVKKFNPAGKISLPNNIVDIEDIDKSISKECINKRNASFVKPTIEEIAAYCASRKSAVDPEAFFAYYESNGWKVGRNPMKNWRMAVVNWEKMKAKRYVQIFAAPKKESTFEHNLRVLDQVTGSNYHEQAYGNPQNPDYDEQ